MADQTLDQLPQAGSADLADLLYTVKFGTLADAKITVGQVLSNAAPVDHNHDAEEIDNLFSDQAPLQDGIALPGNIDRVARVDHVHPANVSNGIPQPLGTASAGTSIVAARSDHVHPLPNATDLGMVPTSRTISTGVGSGLSGGGDLSNSRFLSLDIISLPDDTSPTSATDYVAVGSSVEGLRRVRLDRLPGSGGGGTVSQAFTIFRVAGQSDVVADQASDILTLAAGSNVTLATDPVTDTITISATGGGGGGAANSFTTIAIQGGGSVIADSATDTLTLVAGDNITLTPDAASDRITISAVGGAGGATTLDGLTDVNVASPADGDRIQWSSTASQWVKVTDETLGLPQNNFIIGNASALPVAVTPSDARKAMGDYCCVTISRIDLGSVAMTFDLLQDVAQAFLITGISVGCTSGTGTVSVMNGGSPVIWTGDTPSIPVSTFLSNISVNAQTTISSGSEVTLSVLEPASLVGFRATLHLVRAG